MKKRMTKSGARRRTVRNTPPTRSAAASAGARSTRKQAHRYLFDEEDDETRITPRFAADVETSYAPAAVVSLRLDAPTLASIDAVAKMMGWNRTGTVKRLISAPLALMLDIMRVNDARKG